MRVAPVMLGLVLGDKAESALRTSFLLDQGEPTILMTRPISILLAGIPSAQNALLSNAEVLGYD